MPRRAASAYLLCGKAFSRRYVLGSANIGIDGGAVVSDLGFIWAGLLFRRPGREPRRGCGFPV